MYRVVKADDYSNRLNAVFEYASDILDYFRYHNKNLTKKQDDVMFAFEDGVEKHEIDLLRDACSYFDYHNDNLTKQQYYMLSELSDMIEEIY